MKVAAVVILYFPEQNVIENIMSYSPYVDMIYAIDNTEKDNESFETKLRSIANCIYLHDNENKGIAARLNEACALARKQGFTWLLTMDQDSYFSGDIFVMYLKYAKEYPKKDVAIFCVNY